MLSTRFAVSSSQGSARGSNPLTPNPSLRSSWGAGRGGLRSRLASLMMLLVTVLIFSAPALAALPRVEPQAVGLDAQKLAAIDTLVAEGLAEKKMPGCVVCVGRHGQIALLKAYGHKQLLPSEVAMTTDTVFDMASITKPVATATSVIKLIEQGKLSLSDKVSAIIPEFAANEKQEITVRDLLIHMSGLLPDNALADYLNGPDEALRKICELKLQNPVGSKFVYSDVNFILLGEIVQRRSGMTLHEFSQKEIFVPLGMTETGYLPREELRKQAAPTEERDGHWMQGEVHDPRAFHLGGVAGHAGLFSTADDMAIYATMMLGQGSMQGKRVLSAESVSLMTADYPVISGIRGLGWDKQTGFSTNKGEGFGPRAFGHGGFTGTVLWIDPDLDLFFVFLSNRVHPNGKGAVNPLAGMIATVVAGAVISTE